MLNKIINKNLIALLVYGLAINSFSFILLRTQVSAKQIESSSTLCKNRKLTTIIGVSSDQLNVAICRDPKSFNLIYYIGQKKGASDLLVLATDKSRYIPEPEGILYQAKNGSYTYQVFATCHPFEKHKDWATVSVLKNGNKIRSEKFKNYVSDDVWCNDLFGQQN